MLSKSVEKVIAKWLYIGVPAVTLLVTAVSVLAIDLIWGMAIGIALHLILDRIKVRTWKA
jgi:hypothetical protein